MLKIDQHTRNELVVAIGLEVIVSLFFPRFYHVACARANFKKELRVETNCYYAPHLLRRNSNCTKYAFFVKPTVLRISYEFEHNSIFPKLFGLDGKTKLQ